MLKTMIQKAVRFVSRPFKTTAMYFDPEKGVAEKGTLLKWVSLHPWLCTSLVALLMVIIIPMIVSISPANHIQWLHTQMYNVDVQTMSLQKIMTENEILIETLTAKNQELMNQARELDNQSIQYQNDLTLTIQLNSIPTPEQVQNYPGE